MSVSTVESPTIVSLSSRIKLLKPTAVNSVLGEARKASASGVDLISLMRGEPDLATPAHINEAGQRALRSGRTMYPDNRGEAKFRDAIAARLSRDGLVYDAGSEILVTPGATFGIYAALMALIDEGDEVLLPEPIYDAYLSPIRMAGGTPKLVAARRNGGRFEIDADALEAACTPKTRVLLLNTPWNPTGTVLRREELERIADIVLRRKLVLISDEIYEAITYDQHRHISPASLSADLRERTVIVNALSKTYCMTGWRVGYCAAPAPILNAMFLVLQQSSRGPATFVQDAAAEALNGPQDCVQKMRDEFTRRRAAVLVSLGDAPHCKVMIPEGGFFAMVDVSSLGIPSDQVRYRLLHEAGVVVIHGSAYGPSGEGLLRVSFAAGGETLALGLERLREGVIAIAASTS